MFSIIKIMQTLNFMKTHAHTPITFKQMYDHILETWGDEVIQKMKSGESDMRDFMQYLNMGEADRNIWISRINLFLEKLREKKNHQMNK